ncbi:MAG: hypothetical protein M1820_010310 [Bogoriella megaspora]|nr:MAG: hypothetical protein M1820_010310 [Bogoriella megaspora]
MAGKDSSRRLFRRIFKSQSLRGDKPHKNEPSTSEADFVSSGDHEESEAADADGALEGLGSGLWFEAYTDFVTSSASPDFHRIAKRLRKESGDASKLHQQDVDRHIHDTSPELTICKEVLVTAKQRQSALKKDPDRSVTRRLQHACDGLAKWAQKFVAVGDIVAQVDPIHVGLPWAGVRAILSISIHDQKSQAEALEGVAQLSKLVCRYAAFEQVYLLDHSMLQESLKLRLGSSLKELYMAIFEYLVEVNIFFERSSARKVLDSLVPSEVLQDLFDTVRKKEAELLRYEAMSIKDCKTAAKTAGYS